MEQSVSMNSGITIPRNAHEAFTLIELVIAIAIVGIMIAIIAPNYMGFLERGRKSSAKSTIRALEQAITLYQADTGQYPMMLKDLVKAPTDEKIRKKWQGPYLKRTEIPDDPWGNKYHYQLTPEGAHPYELYTYGPKGRGAAKEEWISVWDEN